MRVSLAMGLLMLSACDGRLGGDRPDAGMTDAARRDTAGLDAPGADVPSIDGGMVSPDVPAVGPCVGVTCGTGASCNPATGTCVCAPGFIDVGGSCMAAMPGDPSTRTGPEVCAAWRDGHVTEAATSWDPGPGMCDPGTMSRDALDDTLRRISMFRWMVGLPPVADEVGRNATDQACAILMFRNGTIDHNPPSTWACYTEAGRAGASSSNLAYGTSDAADAIDLFISDAGVSSLGHRRWIFNGPLGIVGIGFAGNSTCLGVFDSSGSGARPWTAWPNPGPIPFEALRDGFGRTGDWSFHGSLVTGSTTVAMTRVSSGAPLAVTVTHPPNGYGPNTVAWAPMGWTPAAGDRYRVTVTGSSEVSYEVELVACD